MTNILRTFVATAVFAGTLTLSSVSPAIASCLPNPAPSPYAFTGEVLATRWDGRWARVRTDAGRTVIVHGTEAPRAVTSIDRHFQTGERYEFHPINGRNPYRDNACTATHLLT